MITVNTHEAKTRFSSLIAAVEKDNETVLVCRNGHPVAEIHAVKSTGKKGLAEPDHALRVKMTYDPTEPLDADDLPEDLR